MTTDPIVGRWACGFFVFAEFMRAHTRCRWGSSGVFDRLVSSLRVFNPQ